MFDQLRRALGNSVILAPGPTETPPWLKELMVTLHHRTEHYKTVLAETTEMLKRLFDAPDGNVLVYPGVGTTAMEAVVQNFVRGSRVYSVNTGLFADKWEKIAAYGAIKIDRHRAEWGKNYSYGEVAGYLSRIGQPNIVLMQAADTSTGIRNNCSFVGRTLHHYRSDALLAVDAVLEAGVAPIKMQQEEIDILVGATQKAFMLFPGLSFVILREKALKTLEEWGSSRRSEFLDFPQELTAVEQKTVRFTHPTAHISGLWALLKIIFEEIGEENWYRMHAERAREAREKFETLGFTNFTRGTKSNGVSVFLPPEGIIAAEILDAMEERGFVLADGMGKLNGKVIRMAHFVGVDDRDLERFFSALEKYLKQKRA